MSYYCVSNTIIIHFCLHLDLEIWEHSHFLKECIFSSSFCTLHERVGKEWSRLTDQSYNVCMPRCRYNNVEVIVWATQFIHFCLHFRLGELKIISESTKQLLRDNERIVWNEYYDDYEFDDCVLLLLLLLLIVIIAYYFYWYNTYCVSYMQLVLTNS